MKLLKESKKDKYYAVNQDCANWYNTLDEVKRDLINFIPYGQESLSEDEKVVVYSLENINKDPDLDYSDLGYDDIVFEFYDNKLHYFHSSKVVDYIQPKPKEIKEFKCLGKDGKYYNVKAYSKVQANQLLRKYLKDKGVN
jgi:hypothetical protein